jgi:hypothetical protein
MLYPQANIFVAGKDCFTAGNRQKAMSAHRHRQLRCGHRLAQLV